MHLKTPSLLLCLLLSACMMVGPDYKEPKKKAAAHWIKNSPMVKEKPIHDANWWQVFHDPTLSKLICTAYQHNLSLQAAAVRVLYTRAQLAQSVGELYPQQQAMTGNFIYQRLGGTSLQGLLPQDFNAATLGFSANWELDFWGKYRRAIRANDANFLSSIAAYDNALLTLIADTANSYINIRTYEELIKVTKENIVVQRIGLDIAKARYQAGETSLLDVEQAQTELSETEATLPTQQSSLRRYKDQLAVLLGLVPSEVDPLLVKTRGIPIAPKSIEAGIPKEALSQRPDIHQARLEAIAQSESIGAVKANLYPAFSLAGSFSFAATNIPPSKLSNIFNWNSRTISAGPGVNWPLLNYGQITNSVRMQDAAFQQSLLNYLNLVLQAQQEIQDSITEYIAAKKSENSLIVANRAAIETTKLALIRYREGESDYTPVLNAEQQQLRVQTSLTNAKAKVPRAVVALYRGLGGGWQIRRGNDIVPEQIKNDMASRTNWGSLLKPENHLAPMTKWKKIEENYLPNW
jgi:NodT family efflux transporter outer membrane factor (OMF) lipoprotein